MRYGGVDKISNFKFLVLICEKQSVTFIIFATLNLLNFYIYE